MAEELRIVTPIGTNEDEAFDRAVRPRKLDEYIGQPRVKAQMQIFIAAARQRGEALDHTLLFGPPGLGKTTLAHIIANELGVNLYQTSGPVLERPGDLAAHLTSLEPNDVLFIDEIHRLSPVVEEALYPALEDFQLDIMIGEGPGARSIKLPLKPFTLVGATTRAGLLTSPLRDRFGITQHLEFYANAELVQIVRRTARILALTIDDAGAREIASRSRGTPRVANRLLRRVRDYAQVKGDGTVDERVAMRPRDVRWRNPSWIRYGSTTSSSVPRSSPTAAARLSTPTGPPSNFSITVSKSLRSIVSKPCGSTSSRSIAAFATRSSTVPSPFTCA